MNVTDAIAAIPLFQGVAEEHRRELAAIAEERTFARGRMIFSEGDEATGFYVVVSGRARVFKVSPEGKEQILNIFGPGEPFGEAPVFAGEQFPANASALEDSHILFFPRPAFIGLIQETPSLALNMLAVLSRRLRKFANLIEGLSLKEVPGRLAGHLLYFSEQDGGADNLRLDVSRGQLASLLGTIPETLSRILSRMASEGLIRLEGSREIRIMDREALEELASGEKRLS